MTKLWEKLPLAGSRVLPQKNFQRPEMTKMMRNLKNNILIRMMKIIIVVFLQDNNNKDVLTSAGGSLPLLRNYNPRGHQSPSSEHKIV